VRAPILIQIEKRLNIVHPSDGMSKLVMPGLVPGIHAFLARGKTWMAGSFGLKTRFAL
jgi:hypothetical protein